MSAVRSPRGATHAYALGSSYEVFWKRLGRVVYVFNPYRNEWILSSRPPSFLEGFGRLNVFEMHPETAESRANP